VPLILLHVGIVGLFCAGIRCLIKPISAGIFPSAHSQATSNLQIKVISIHFRFPSVALNGSRLGDGGEIEAHIFDFELNFN